MNFEKTIEPCDLPAALGDTDLLAQMVLRTKGVVLDSLLEDEAVTRAARDPEVRELMEKKRLFTAQLLQTQENASGTDFSDSPAAIANRKKLEKEEQDLEASLVKKGVGSGRMRRALATDVADVREALPKNAVLVEFIAYNRYKGNLGYEPAYGALVLSHDAPARWIPLGPTTAIDAQVKCYQKYMRKPVREAAMADVLHGLDQALCQPILNALPSGTHRLIISPDSNLNFVSFATLLDPQDRFVGENFDVNYVSSGRDLLEETKTVPLNKKMVVFADPDYSHLSGSSVTKTHAKGAASDDVLLAPLPGTEREATFLLQVAKSEGMGVQLYRGQMLPRTI